MQRLIGCVLSYFYFCFWNISYQNPPFSHRIHCIFELIPYLYFGTRSTLKFRLGNDENNKKRANAAKCGPPMQDDPLATLSCFTEIESSVIPHHHFSPRCWCYYCCCCCYRCYRCCCHFITIFFECHRALLAWTHQTIYNVLTRAFFKFVLNMKSLSDMRKSEVALAHIHTLVHINQGKRILLRNDAKH